VMLAGSVHEEALMAVGALADAMESEFVKYLPHVKDFVLLGLRNWEQYEVCAVAVGVVGDLARSVQKAIMAYADDIVTQLLNALRSGELDKSVKPRILSVFGDLAMALGGEFERYLAEVMVMLHQAAQSSLQLQVPPDDYDTLEWVVSLRESIFEAYTGVLQGLRADTRHELLARNHVEWVLEFCDYVSREPDACSDKLLGAAAGVVGDLASTMPGARAKVRTLAWVQPLLDRASNSPDPSVQETGLWARHALTMAP